MIKAYYTATNGAVSNQNYLDVMSNNIANVQTDGYKKSKAEFSDLLYTNIKGTETQVGSGSKLNKVDTIFSQGAPYATGNETDYAILGDGFFAVQFEDKTYFTRGGSFEETNIDGENYLMYQGGYVLDENEEPILIENKNDVLNEVEEIEETEKSSVGVFVLANNSDLKRVGNNLFEIANEDAEYSLSENPKVMKGYLEASSVEIAEEMVKMIQIQRAFQFNSKVIQTSDEIEQTINSLRG